MHCRADEKAGINPEDDLLARALRDDINYRRTTDDEVIFQTVSGLELRFVKEDNLWRFDLAGYF
jgi:hypothetical protein